MNPSWNPDSTEGIGRESKEGNRKMAGAETLVRRSDSRGWQTIKLTSATKGAAIVFDLAIVVPPNIF